MNLHLLPDNTCGVEGPDLEVNAVPTGGQIGEVFNFTAKTGGAQFVSYEWSFLSRSVGNRTCSHETYLGIENHLSRFVLVAHTRGDMSIT